MSKSYTLVGFEMSYFTGKVRAYLRCKGIPFTQHSPTFREGRTLVTGRIGFYMVPILISPTDETLQDSSYIIAELEKRHPEPSMIPATPRQRLASYLFELLGDEWMIPPAMHYRWQVGKPNQKRFLDDAAQSLFPWLPHFIGFRLADHYAAKAMRAHLAHLDLGEEMQPVVRRWTEQLCDNFDAHFARYPFLLGHAPSIGDFGLQGPFYAHLGADPWPKEHLMAPRRHFSEWVARVQFAHGPFTGKWLANDEVPATLDPIVRRFAREYVPFLRLGAGHLNAWARDNDYRTCWVPRGLPASEYRLGDTVSRRRLLTSNLYKAQRLQDHIDSLNEAERSNVQLWLDRVGIQLEDLRIPNRPRFERRNFRFYITEPGND